MGWAPYEVPLRGLRSGVNEIELRLTNTLRNMMGPSHQTVGEWGACSIASWLCDRADFALYEQDSPTRTDSFILTSYGICEPSLVMRGAL